MAPPYRSTANPPNCHATMLPPNQIVGFDPQDSPLKKEEEHSAPLDHAEQTEHTE